MTNYSKWDKFASDLASDSEAEEERDLADFAKKTVRYIHVPPGDFRDKTQLCQLLEEDPHFEAPSSAAAGINLGDGAEAGVDRAVKKYKWTSVSSQFLPGYGNSTQGDDIWRIFYDDMFLTSQTEPNRAARALLGYQSLGSFVVSCLDRKTGEDRLISRKEVADLVMKRQRGGDAERITVEHEQQKATMDSFSQLGGQRVELG
ncbi:unnamed protein product [Polarella glacialis]|uniref:Uncharacterized protein n=1 Tax=Polarella glacialis TaxID=89957 RepID=A0A813FEY3_POLGL|nr:unnamed protein product [Polarella glacialis]